VGEKKNEEDFDTRVVKQQELKDTNIAIAQSGGETRQYKIGKLQEDYQKRLLTLQGEGNDLAEQRARIETEALEQLITLEKGRGAERMDTAKIAELETQQLRIQVQLDQDRLTIARQIAAAQEDLAITQLKRESATAATKGDYKTAETKRKKAEGMEDRQFLEKRTLDLGGTAEAGTQAMAELKEQKTAKKAATTEYRQREETKLALDDPALNARERKRGQNRLRYEDLTAENMGNGMDAPGAAALADKQLQSETQKNAQAFDYDQLRRMGGNLSGAEADNSMNYAREQLDVQKSSLAQLQKLVELAANNKTSGSSTIGFAGFGTGSPQ
jgi:hypothetical protein